MNSTKRSWYQKKRFWIPGGLVGLIILGSAVGGIEETSTSTDAKPQATKSVTPKPTPTETEKSADEALEDLQESNQKGRDELQEQIDEAEESAASEPVPDVVGMNHADAMDVLHEAGFLVDEESVSPGNTFIILNSNWKVCSQDPGAGATDVVRVTINSVKLNESC